MIVVLLATAAEAGWRDDVAAAVATCAVDPIPCEDAAAIGLRETRAGFLVSGSPVPAGVPFVADRLLHEVDPRVRRGLADALLESLASRESPGWDAVWIGLVVEDPQVDVRGVLVDGLRRAPLAVAGPGLRAAAAHADPTTRADAARNMGGHADVAGFVPDLARLCADPDPAVVAAAVRALSWAARLAPLDDDAKAALRTLASSADPAVRDAAARVLGAP